jgi:hypothetical protein
MRNVGRKGKPQENMRNIKRKRWTTKKPYGKKL